MLTLTLLRHAKSDWNQDSLDDFDRPLATRGLKAAPVIGRELKKRGPAIDLVLCSPAKRTSETLDLVLSELTPVTPDIQYIEGLYHAPPEHLWKHVMNRAASALHVLVVAHNPGLHLLAMALAQRDSNLDDLAALAAKFPTAAFAQFTFAGDTWADIVTGSGQLTHFVTPHSLS